MHGRVGKEDQTRETRWREKEKRKHYRKMKMWEKERKKEKMKTERKWKPSETQRKNEEWEKMNQKWDEVYCLSHY